MNNQDVKTEASKNIARGLKIIESYKKPIEVRVFLIEQYSKKNTQKDIEEKLACESAINLMIDNTLEINKKILELLYLYF